MPILVYFSYCAKTVRAVGDFGRREKERTMAKYPFLSPEWIEEAKKIRDEYAGKNVTGALPASLKANLVITEVPFGDGTLDAHFDTTKGDMLMDTGHIDDAEVKITVDYQTAKAVFLENNPQAGMQAFMAGKIRIEGDMAKLMALQTATPNPEANEVIQKLLEITE